MSFEETLEKFVRDIVAEQFENNDKLQERLAKLESIVGELNVTAYSHIQRFETLERRLIGLEESVHNCVTRKEAGDVAYEVIRDADLDELLGSYVKDKVEEVIVDDDDLRDRLHNIIDEKLERVKISLKVM